MISNVNLLAFASAFIGCVLVTPIVTRLATWAGAIDRPDQFRRIHKGAVPRMGGLGLAFGLGLSLSVVVLGGYLRDWAGFPEWWSRQWAVAAAAAIVLMIGVVDDTRGISPRLKLLGQAAAVLVLFKGGIRIEQIVILGLPINVSHPVLVQFPGIARALAVDLPSLLVTLVWFLGCMNIWNLIDGMDGLASGVGLLVSGTLMLVAIHQQNLGSAILSAALAGGLAGFLLYNWHPACIFLGDSGSLLIGLLIGVVGVQDMLKGTTAVSILFPILAMGLPISDTAMAIFRRWVRDLPLSSADRRHVHHLLIGLGLDPRQAAVMLYCFTTFLCGVVLLGVARGNEFLALILGVSGCLVFLLVLTSRRDELTSLVGDLQARLARGRQERSAAKLTWEAIQKIEICEDAERIWENLKDSALALGCESIRLVCTLDGRTLLRRSTAPWDGSESWVGVSGPTATFRIQSGQDLHLSLSVHHNRGTEAGVVADIAFRFLQRLSLATAERLARLLSEVVEAPPGPIEDQASLSPDGPGAAGLMATRAEGPVSQADLFPSRSGRRAISWLRWTFGEGRP